MIITGILITAVAVILMVAAMLLVAGGSTTRSSKGVVAGIGIVLYLLCFVGYIVGLATIAIGIVQALGWA
jgi:hypothetical protein